MLHRSVYGTPLGRRLLTFQLQELGHFDTELTVEQQVLRDYSIRLLRLCGIHADENVKELVDSYFDIPMKPGALGTEEGEDE